MCSNPVGDTEGSKPSGSYSSGKKDAQQTSSIKAQLTNVNDQHRGAKLGTARAGGQQQTSASCTKD